MSVRQVIQRQGIQLRHLLQLIREKKVLVTINKRSPATTHWCRTVMLSGWSVTTGWGQRARTFDVVSP